MAQYKMDYELDIPNIQSTFNNFKTRFANLENLNVYDKIYFDSSNVVHISHSGYFQSTSRWLNSYNREKMYKNLNKNIDEYLKYCEMLSCYRTYMQNSESAQHFNDLFNESFAFISKIIIGIETLCKTYSDDKALNEKLSNIITKLTNKIIINTIL